MIKNLKILYILFKTFGIKAKYILIMIARFLIFIITSVSLFADRLIFIRLNKKMINKPVFLIGHPRSGTTFLHRFIVEHCKDIRGMYLWEMIFPSLTSRKLIKPFLPKFKNISLDKVWDPKIHKANMLFAETEDVALFFKYFDGLLSWVYFYIWDDFKDDNDFESRLNQTCGKIKFLNYLKKVHIRNIYKNTTQRMLSKSFALIFNYEQIKHVFPGAKVLLLIRDPLEAIPSFMSLERHVQNNLNGLLKLSGGMQSKYYNNIYKTSMIYYKKFHNVIVNNKDNKDILVITYKELKENFEDTIKKIVDFYGIKYTQELEEAVKKQEEKQKTFKTEHKYSVDEFGFTKEKVERDFAYIYENYYV
jgi:hypothetical protein